MRNQWIAAIIAHVNEVPEKCYFFVCDRHFEPSLVIKKADRTTLGKGSIPTIFPNVQNIDIDLISNERDISLPTPPADWVIKKTNPKEIVDFHEQERRRFEHPDKAFTYRMHGYESVVGPVEGIYTKIPVLIKPCHTILNAHRPSFVTVLSLVRDATARLPKGEGTITDICAILKSSQYICASTTETELQTTVNGALDRINTENDPCVRYDSKRKIWIYLHRNRTEEEFEKMHQQFQSLGKQKYQNTRNQVKLPASTEVQTISKSPDSQTTQYAVSSSKLFEFISICLEMSKFHRIPLIFIHFRFAQFNSHD